MNFARLLLSGIVLLNLLAFDPSFFHLKVSEVVDKYEQHFDQKKDLNKQLSDVRDVPEEVKIVDDTDINDERDKAHKSRDNPGARHEDYGDHCYCQEEPSMFCDRFEDWDSGGVDCMRLLIPSATVA